VISNPFVHDVHDFLHDGDSVKVLVLSTDNGKINLSVKRALPQEARPAPRAPRPPAHSSPRPAFRPSGGRGGQTTVAPSGDLTFEDKLKQLLSASDSKMADLNRNIDGKRSGGRRRK